MRNMRIDALNLTSHIANKRVQVSLKARRVKKKFK